MEVLDNIVDRYYKSTIMAKPFEGNIAKVARGAGRSVEGYHGQISEYITIASKVAGVAVGDVECPGIAVWNGRPNPCPDLPPLPDGSSLKMLVSRERRYASVGACVVGEFGIVRQGLVDMAAASEAPIVAEPTPTEL